MPKVEPHRYARPAWERMMHIHRALQDGRHPNCRQLARDLEVVPRTIKRDVDFMRYRLHLPIAYDPQRRGYRYTEPVKTFPDVAVTEQEVFALLVAHKAIAHYRGTPFERILENAFKKLADRLDTGTRHTLGDLEAALSFRPFAPDDTDLHNFETLTRAVREHREVCFQYRNLGTRQARARRVRPYHLACIENHWYLFGFDVARQAVRTFALGRLQNPVLTPRHFRPPRNFNLDEYLRGSLGVFRGQADYEVVIDFDAWAGDLVRGRHWHATQELTELPSGEVRLRLRLNSLEEAERWVLSWGVHATVVRPRALARRIQDIAATLARRYDQLLPASAEPPAAGA